MIPILQSNFFLYDALSSNGTMLFLSRPLELDWNKTMHVKIGRTILTLKSKKRWKWAGAAFGDQSGASEAAESRSAAGSPPLLESAADAFLSTPTHRATGSSPPPPAPARAASTSHSRALHRSVPTNRFDAVGSASARSDPSAELATSPFAAHSFLGRSHGDTSASVRRALDAETGDVVDEEPLLAFATRQDASDRDEMLEALLVRRQHQLRPEPATAAVDYAIADAFADLSFAADDCDHGAVERN